MDFFNEIDDDQDIFDADGLFDDDKPNTTVDEEQAILEDRYEPSKEATLLLVDADLEFDNMLHEEVFCSLESFVRHKIIASKDDRIAIVKYNTKNAKNYSNFPGILTLHDFEEPGTELVKQIRDDKYTRYGRLERGGRTSGAVMAEVFWNASQMFKLQIGETLTFKRRVMVFSGNDDPLGQRGETDAARLRDLQTTLDITLTRVSDCQDLGLEIEFYPVVRANRPFSLDLFWNKVISPENIDEADELALARIDTSPNAAKSSNMDIVTAESEDGQRNFRSLESRIRKRLFKKRALTRTILYLKRDPDVALGVSVYINILEAKLPPPVWLHAVDNGRVIAEQKLVERIDYLKTDMNDDGMSAPFTVGSVTKDMAGQTNFPIVGTGGSSSSSSKVDPNASSLVHQQSPGGKLNLTGDHQPVTHHVRDAELASYVEFAGEKIPFTDEEIKKLRNFGEEPCMELIGFLDRKELKPYHHYTHSYLVYPNEKRIIGSTALFKSLLTSLRKRNVMMLVWFRARANAEPRLSALIASEDQDVFNLIPLPHKEDYRKETAVPVLDTKREPELDAPNTCMAMRHLLNRICLDSFHTADVANVSIQKHYAALQALALGEAEVEPVVDELRPDPDCFADAGMLMLLDTLEKSKPAAELLAICDQPAPVAASKAAKASSGAGSKRQKLDSGTAAASPAEPVITAEQMARAVQQNQLEFMKVTFLKQFLKSVGLRVDGKKTDLIQKIKTYHGVKHE
ncbi:unnamed protein product [Amoebophrya sp. A120]|nr:unnamed protein product [Amoebophrya sp. A120]|eukprot:GSA120T00003103001.1